jgi:hypothetical protein
MRYRTCTIWDTFRIKQHVFIGIDNDITEKILKMLNYNFNFSFVIFNIN